MSEYKLTSEILALSAAKTWDEAKLEWHLEHIRKEDEPATCLCGHYPIAELCTIVNLKTGLTAIVGNCCVKKFIGLASDKIFQAVKRVQKDLSRALNAETIEHAHRKGWIDDWKRNFYFETMRKRRMSPKQMEQRRQINKVILRHVIGNALLSRAQVARTKDDYARQR